MAASFRQLWDGLHFARLGGDLVSVPAAIRRVIFDGLRRDARSCAGGNRAGGILASLLHRHSARLDQFLPILLLLAAVLVLLSYLVFSERARSSVRCGI